MNTSSKNLIRLAVLSILMLLPLRAPAQIYECLDADGRREFAQKCSPGTVSTREVSTAGATSPDVGAPAKSSSYKQQEIEFQQRRIQREDKDAKEKAATADAARKCKNAQYRLSQLEITRRLPNGKDPKTGDVIYLTQDERAAEIKKAQDGVAASCK
ncbi:MAG: DUF4124 domain-containing protein [Burkholderiales bacterium]